MTIKPETELIDPMMPSEQQRVVTLCDTFIGLGGTAFMSVYNMAPDPVKDVYDKVGQILLQKNVVKLEDFQDQD